MQRIYAHRIIFGNDVYANHVAELDDAGNLKFYPFDREIHSTVFISGTIRLTVADGRMIYEQDHRRNLGACRK